MARSRRRDARARSGRKSGSSPLGDCAFLDWSAGSFRTSIMQRPCGDCGQKHEAGDVIKPNRD